MQPKLYLPPAASLYVINLSASVSTYWNTVEHLEIRGGGVLLGLSSALELSF